MAVVRTFLIITLLLLGWAAIRTDGISLLTHPAMALSASLHS